MAFALSPRLLTVSVWLLMFVIADGPMKIAPVKLLELFRRLTVAPVLPALFTVNPPLPVTTPLTVRLVLVAVPMESVPALRLIPPEVVVDEVHQR